MAGFRHILRLAVDPGAGAGVIELHAAAARLGARIRSAGALSPAGLRPLPPWRLVVRACAAAGRGGSCRLAALAALGLAACAASAAAFAVHGAAWLSGPAAADAGSVAAEASALFSDGAATRRFLAFLHAIARGDGTIADMFLLANLAVLFLCGLIILAQFAQAVIDTARGGRPGASGVQVLRAVAILALITPLDGFSAIQHLVLGAARLGGSAASGVWTAFSTRVVAEGAIALPVVAGRGHQRLIGQFLVAETCRAVANSRAAGLAEAPWVTAVERRNAGGAGRHVVIGYDAPDTPGACGVVRFLAAGRDAAAARIADAHRAALLAVLPEIRSLAAAIAGRFVDGSPDYGRPLPDKAGALARAGIAERYAAQLNNGIAAVYQASVRDLPATIAAQADADGWLAAPLVFQRIARSNGGIQAAARAVPTVDPPAAGYAAHVPDAIAAARAVRRWLDADGSGSGAVDIAGDSIFATLIDQLDIRLTLVDDAAPLSSLAALGHTLVSGGLKGFAIVAGVVTGSNFLRSIPLVGDGLDTIGAIWRVIDTPVTTVLMALFAAGGILAWLVPLIPFIRFAFALAVWLLAVLEALLGAPIWLIAFLSSDKDRLWPAAVRDGAGLLLAVILRPLLMIFGLVLGYLAASLMCGYLNSGFETLIGTGDGDGHGPIDWLVNVVIYTLLAWLLVNFAFAAIDRMPAAALAWIGVRINAAGGEAAGRSVAGALGRAERMRPDLPGSHGGHGRQ